MTLGLAHSLSTYLIIIILPSVIPRNSPGRASTSDNEFYCSNVFVAGAQQLRDTSACLHITAGGRKSRATVARLAMAKPFAARQCA